MTDTAKPNGTNGTKPTGNDQTEPQRYDTLGRRIGERQGRQSTFDPDVADRICEAIATGTKPGELYEHDGIPSQRTVWNWLGRHESFATDFARAMHRRADWRAGEIDNLIGEVLQDGDAAKPPNAVRTAFDMHKWLASKENPSRYGDKVTNVHEGGDKPLQVQTMTLADLTMRLDAMASTVDEPDEDA